MNGGRVIMFWFVKSESLLVHYALPVVLLTSNDSFLPTSSGFLPSRVMHVLSYFG